MADMDIRVSKILVHPIKSCRGTSVQESRYTPEGLEHDRRFCIVEADSHKVITAREVAKMVLITPRIHEDSSSTHGGVLTISFPEDSGCASFSVPLFPVGFEDKWERVNDIELWGTTIDGFICQSIFNSPSASVDVGANANANARADSDVDVDAKTNIDANVDANVDVNVNAGASASAILSKYMDRPVHLVVKGSTPRSCDPTDTFPKLKATARYQDCYPLLVLSEESMGVVKEEVGRWGGFAGDGGDEGDGGGRVAGIGEEWKGRDVVIERFRPNIVIRGAGPFAEDHFEEVSIGGSSEGILLVSKCARCLLPNVSPDTGVRDKAVPYKVLMKFRTGVDPLNKMKPCVGCHGVPLGNGTIRVGDEVFVKKMIVA
ncbi:hypothetical protein GYMLUDRAFT_42185 [Collybiopsis luxurians FD-317 M1]|uniref:MOSC domain-containing protein n=1 Tax=Collybiopsis luxurians FD-317 M1 TaxID=944289 RepID=A0A0D0CZZ6_9AGAR|nr:hypothetical protein GYMLUDRAFT_42185 [Collybiopsis luxurians FD-317 M1]